MFDRQSNNRNGNNSGNGNGDWKAAAFINLFLSRKSGTKMKLGFIALKEQDPEHAQLMSWIEVDPETRLPALLEKLVLEYRRVEAKQDDGLDL